MNGIRNYFCELCGEMVTVHQLADEIIGHSECIKAIKKDMKLLKKIATEIEKKKRTTVELNALRILLKLKIRDLKKMGGLQ